MSYKQITYRLTNAQKSIWQIVKFYPDTTFVNIAFTVNIRECLDYDLLNKAINIAIKENDAMRICVVENGKDPEQYFAEYKEQQFELFDFSYSNGLDDLKQWEKIKSRERIKLIDAKLYYIALIKLSDNEGAFFIRFHHIIGDAWSVSLLIRQILQNYCKLLNNREEVMFVDRPSYKDFIKSDSQYLTSQRFIKNKVFWNNLFSTVPEFSVFNNRIISSQTTAERKTFVLPDNLTSMIKKFSIRENSSPFCIFFSALTIYIWKLTSKTDIVIGTPVLNRSGVKEKNTMGMFISTIPFRIKLNPNLDFNSLVKSISHQWNALLKHQKYPYDLILKNFRETNEVGEKLIDISLSFQNAAFNVSDIDFNAKWLFNGSELNALSIHINDRQGEGNYFIDYDYLIDVLSEAEINRLHESMTNLLDNALRKPDVNITDIKMLSPEQEFNLLWKFNDTQYDYPREETIVSLFEKQAGLTPKNVAVIFENKEFTYEELNDRANQLARLLRATGATRDFIVGLIIDRSIELIIAILAVLKAGGAYLPIDPAYPGDRIDYMLEDSKCQLLLTNNINKKLDLEFDGMIFNLTDLKFNGESSSNLELKPLPSDLAYVIYTSGSTGNPKGVMIEHKGLNNFVHSLSKLVENPKKALSIATVSFDLFFVETIFPLLQGMVVVLANKEEAKVPYLLLELINRYKVDFVLATPSRIKLILNDSMAYVLKDVTEFFIGGENFPEPLLEDLKLASNGRILNAYGPTETSICATIKNLSEGSSKRITIGKPIANTYIYILDESLKPVPIEVLGEIYISGDCLGRGYSNNEELTKERFIPNPFILGSRMYKTGDLGRWLSNGEIEYSGRNDNQVKVRGLRIELGEIENFLLKHELIKETVVLCHEDNSQKKHLVAYITSKGKVSGPNLREYLSSFLPEYMIPGNFVILESFPLTPNGKVDRKALPKPEQTECKLLYVPPSNILEQKLVRLWEDALNKTKIGIDDNFFDLGGDSLVVLEILSGLYPNDWGLSAQDFYDYSTIRKLAGKIKDSDIKKNHSQNHDQVLVSFAPVPKCRTLNITTGNILLTGATGFLGIHILYELLCTTKEKIYCLVRGKNSERRFYQLFDYYFPSLLQSSYQNRVTIINGDISQEGFGLSQVEQENLAKAVTRVIHTAASVGHYGDYEEFNTINVKGTQEVVNFCLENGKKLNHISTISVSGNFMNYHPELKEFTESDLYIGQNYYENVYIRTKFQAENLIFNAMNNGLKATVFRVGALTGRFTDGKFQINIEQNALYRQLKAIILLEHIPQDFIREYMEFTPVDYCAKAIVKLIQENRETLPVYHVFNHNKISIRELVILFKAVGVRINAIPQSEFERLIASISATSSGKEIVNSIISSLSINRTIGLVSNVKVNSSLSVNALRNAGFEWPQVHDEYILKVLGYMQATGFLKKISESVN